MSTKKLQKTVIEGGRVKHNKWERRYSSKEERAYLREYISNFQKDIEYVENNVVKPRRTVYKEFRDKLGPMHRWLHSQVGRNWNDVKSEVFEKFDTRTTAGRHITYDHLLSSVEEVPDLRYRHYYYLSDLTDHQSHYKNDFYVDDAGILRVKEYVPYRTKVSKFDTASIANWLNGRVVGKIGKKLFWFIPADKNKKGGYSHEWKTQWGRGASYYSEYALRYLYLYYDNIYSKEVDEAGNRKIIDRKPVWRESIPSFRQDRKLNEKELVFWNSIPEYYQNKVLEYSPTNPNPPPPRRYW